MSDVTKNPVLVLNSCFEPMNICNGRRALSLVLRGIASAVEEADVIVYKTTMWDEVSGEHVEVGIKLPSVIRILGFKYIPARKKFVSRKNIMTRDQNSCAYCGHRSNKKLTIDHVIPKSRGGKDTWENMVAACAPCNKKKGNRMLSEIPDMILRKPPRPINGNTGSAMLIKIGSKHPVWRKYLYCE